MHRVYINAPLDYVMGHLRYGHFEGLVELDDERFAEFQKDPVDTIEKYDLIERLDLEIDDYEIDDWGHIMEVDWEELN